MLFSGGEPLVRQDLPELASYATEKGMRARSVLDQRHPDHQGKGPPNSRRSICSYVGISLDGAEEIHDKFRGVPNSFKRRSPRA